MMRDKIAILAPDNMATDLSCPPGESVETISAADFIDLAARFAVDNLSALDTVAVIYLMDTADGKRRCMGVLAGDQCEEQRENLECSMTGWNVTRSARISQGHMNGSEHLGLLLIVQVIDDDKGAAPSMFTSIKLDSEGRAFLPDGWKWETLDLPSFH
jgi:hypothetical protein